MTTPLLPALILTEVRTRGATFGTVEGAPWSATTVIDPKPLEEFAPAHGQVRVIVERGPAPLEGRQDQHTQMHWTLDVRVMAYIVQQELPPEGEDTRLSVDELGFAGIDAMLKKIDADSVFGSVAFAQLCDTVTVVDAGYGIEEGTTNFGSFVVFRFTFQTRSRSLREHNYPAA